MQLAEQLTLPIEALAQTFAILGKRGVGKTYCAIKLAEEMLLAGGQIVAIDPVGVWYGLRVPQNKAGQAFDVLVFGGLNADIPINYQSGRLIAETIIKRNISAVVDISQFTKSEESLFVFDFLTSLFELKKKSPSPLHLFLEEAHEIVPQSLSGKGKKSSQVLEIGERIVKLGRNYGIGCSMISQRPQSVNKNVLNQAEVLLCFQMIGMLEKKAINDWVRNTESDVNMLDTLPKLKVGEAHIWSPTFLEVADTYKILPKITADVSATPKFGAVHKKPRKLEATDITDLQNSIASLIEQHETDKPENLKKKITVLSRENRDLQRRVNFAEENQDVAEFPYEEAEELKAYIAETYQWANDFNDSLGKQFGHFDRSLKERIDQIREFTREFASKIPAKAVKPITSGVNRSFVRQRPTPAPLATQNNVLSNPQQRILDSLATFRELGVNIVNRSNVAMLAKYSPKSSSFSNAISALRNSQGANDWDPLVEYHSGSQLSITQEGLTLANPLVLVGNDGYEDLHNAWLSFLSGPQEKILRHLLQDPTRNETRRNLADATGYSIKSSSFSNSLSGLRTLGVLDYVKVDGEPGVFLTDLLFL